MSLSDIISTDLASALADLSVADFTALVKAASVGFGPSKLKAGVDAIHRGDEVPLPSGLGQAGSLKIVAWSFCSDHGQFADTYGVSVARAAELKHQLRYTPDDAIAEIRKIVTDALEKKGSLRPVVILRDGIPGSGTTDHSGPRSAQLKSDLKKEIKSRGTLYGMYKFVAEDSGRQGDLHFRVRLGAGLWATAASKSSAIDVARICRVNGRSHELVADRVCFWRDGKAPVFGVDIPESVTFDGKLKPGQALPADPVSKARTEAPSGSSSPK